MACKYTVKDGSRRWPVQVFYNILDLAGINAWIDPGFVVRLASARITKRATVAFTARKWFAEAALHALSVGMCALIVMPTLRRMIRRRRRMGGGRGLGRVRRTARMMTLPMR